MVLMSPYLWQFYQAEMPQPFDDFRYHIIMGNFFQREVSNLLLLRKTFPLFTTGAKHQQTLDMYLHTNICTSTHFSFAVYFPSDIFQITFPKCPYKMPGNPNGGKSSYPFSTTACKCKSSWKLPRGKWPWETHWDTWQKSKPTHWKELQTKTGLKTSAPPVTSCHINHC